VRQHDDDTSARLIVLDVHGAVVGLHHVADDGEPEAGAATLGCPVVVDADEAFEDALAILWRHARAVVGDDRRHGGAVVLQLDRDAACRMPHRIVEKVGHDPIQR
jgi:hypothetical protein